MKALRFASLMLVTACVCSLSVADDGAINNKSMSRTIQVPEFDSAEVNAHLPEAEHAFTGMMGFYVPAQASNGELDPIEYCDIDNQPESGGDCTAPVETLDVAKPLVNVFIYGPALGVHGTAFAHSYMDTYGAVSLDDGETFKKTNLSETATESSFDLEEDHIPPEKAILPADHDILFGSKNNGAYHAPGYDIPYTAHCTECHGPGLVGTTQAPSCYSCHDSNKWDEEPPADLGPIITEAIWKNGKLAGSGENGPSKGFVTIENAETGHEITTVASNLLGDFDFNTRPEDIDDALLPPCTVSASYDDYQGPALRVVDKNGVPVENCVGYADDLIEYPGGTYNVFHAVAGNKVLVAWPSRFCQQGQPAYSFAYDGNDDDLNEDNAADLLAKREAVVNWLDIDVEEDLYLTDLFGVGGSQGSIDFGEEGYPQAGVVPFGCVWTARGILLPGDDPRTVDFAEESYMLWTKAERLTSGRRDPNRIEVHGAAGAGFVITWQEDPDGLRPGQGEGPGEGWSGAVAHDKTDVWYSFIPWEHFDLVENPDDVYGEPVKAEDHDLLLTGRPQVYVPMAVPMRLTNNDKCAPEYFDPGITDPTDKKYFSYCNFEVAEDYGLQNFCDDVVEVPQGPEAALKPICVNEDGLPNIANTGATRPRTSLQGYDSDKDDVIDSAWVIVALEESKGLGRYAFLPDGTPCEALERKDDGYDPDCLSDIGKNQWYFSFDMGDPQTSATAKEEYGLVLNLVGQGNLLNQPEIDWRTGEFYPTVNTEDMWEFGDYNYDLYNTEIARRASLLVQPIAKAMGTDGELLATPSWKQGAMRQGGPADTMLRRILLPDGYKLKDGIKVNPYAFTNMDCTHPGGGDGWILDKGENPYYPAGICTAPATNLSGVVPDSCIDDATGGEIPCPIVDFSGTTYGIGDTNPILQGYVQGEGNTTRVLTWHQCPSDNAIIASDDTIDPVTCDTDYRTDVFANLRDQSWYNPLDVSKGHRGFIDGDFVMFLYAWSPNWRLNAKGSDRYDLYVRRSFDGGQTWTTTPAGGTASDGQPFGGDGTVTCESYRDTTTGDSNPDEPKVCYEFAAGAAEHARNVTQHKSMRITTLDPRYAPTRPSIAEGCLDGLGLEDSGLWGCDDLSTEMDSDLRNPSRFFMVFETGDNTTSAYGEAEPLDLYYSRAESFGDDFVVWTETDTTSADLAACFPTVNYGEVLLSDDVRIDSGFCNEFDRMNTAGDTHSSEASLAANADGSKMYGVWAQWVFEDGDDYESEIEESDAMARRVWWIDDYVSDTEAYTLPGVNSGTP